MCARGMAQKLEAGVRDRERSARAACRLRAVSALELHDVVKRYGARDALRGVSLALAEGAALGLLGPNGAGKSTVLRLLLGFAAPTSGVVALRGLDPRDPHARRGVGYLPERVALPERATVVGTLTLSAGLAGLSGADRDAAVAEMLDRVGLGERVRDPIGELSKGLRQRVGFAMALVAKPALLLLDEPTSGLDPLGIRDARGWIQRAREQGAALLMCSHTLSEIERVCDHVAILNEGALAASGPIGEILREGESLEDAFVRVVRG
jgi:ABC-2 type transport system ATP-binding protein